MKRQVAIIIGLTLVLAAAAGHASIPAEFFRSGAGTIRYLGFIKVYDASLYVPPGITRGDILAADSSRCLRLEYEVELSVADFIEAAEHILERQHEPSELAALKPHLDELHRSYRDVGKGDSYTLCYDGRLQRTQLYFNGNPLVTVDSAEFAAAYFGIWLADKNPLDEALRRNLLDGLAEGGRR